MKTKVYSGLLKLFSDIENKRSYIMADIVRLDETIINISKHFLISHSDKYKFGSHDAIIAATAIVQKQKGIEISLITSDKGLKAALKEEGISYYDPNIPLEVPIGT